MLLCRARTVRIVGHHARCEHAVREECGIAAVYALKNGMPDAESDVAPFVTRLLLDMQMRGELSAGMTSYDPSRRRLLVTYKQVGTVNEAFRLGHSGKSAHILAHCRGCAAIGHVRYSACGPDDRAYAQPFERQHGRIYKWFSFGCNGQLANYALLRDRLKQQKGYHVVLDTDTEIIMHYLSRELAGEERPPLERVFGNVAREFDGAYSLAFLNADGELVVARDPLGFRPLCYGIRDDLFAAASESAALANLGFKEVFSLEPGCLVLINRDGVAVRRFAESPRRATCFFEWVYFANAGSAIDGCSVYLTRNRLGRILAEIETVPKDDDLIVVPVPDTAKAAADGMAYHLGIPVLEGLLRNRYVGRTFIKSGARSRAVSLKYTPVREVLEGKRVLLVEDSIVRGTTLKHLIGHIRERGRPREVHLRIAAPPILYPCFYGIDMSTVGELFARAHVAEIEDEIPEPIRSIMAAELGADSLRYVPRAKIPVAIGLPGRDLCTACIDAHYPTEAGRHLHGLAEAAHRAGITSCPYTTSPVTPTAPRGGSGAPLSASARRSAR
jgi:amidophosphoribosyltransferase